MAESVLCPCPCQQPLTPDQIRRGGRYRSRSCFLRTFQVEQRRRHFYNWIRSDEAKAHTVLSANGQKGGTHPHPRFAALLEKWMDLGPREALRQAYADGYGAGWDSGRRKTKRQEVDRVA